MSAFETVRFYFSFRSPYSWLAFHRLGPALAKLPVTIDRIPVFPPPDYPNDPTAVPNKAAYIAHDVARVAEAYGLPFRSPDKLDTEWVRPHAAFLFAKDQGRDDAFGKAMYAARWSRGEDVGDDAVMAAAAREAEIDADGAVAAANDEAKHKRVWEGMIQAAGEDNIFGVPYYVFRGERFWGNDRIDWLVRSVRKAHDMPVVDLREDFLEPLDR
jgi:2-hydroxychromene-2-carboxylate isomerase